MMETPVINSDLDALSHAHPLPFRPSPREQQVRESVARIPIIVNLRGLSFGRVIAVSDVLKPKVRRAPFNENVNPNHLDVIECWKGLSYTRALELTMWYEFLHECLHNEVQEVLSKELVQDLLDSNESIDDVYVVARMLESLRTKPQRIIDISFVDVIDSMMSKFHNRFPNETASKASSWSHVSGGLSLFLHNFLRLQDCFQHNAQGTCLEISFSFQFARWALTATGDVAWQPPNIRFLHVPTSRATGEMYRITPFVWKAVDSPIKSPGCDDYVDQIDYTIVQSPATFTWDPLKRCFNTVVGYFGDGKLHTVETKVMATINTLFPDGVKFERRSRWSMKVEVNEDTVGSEVLQEVPQLAERKSNNACNNLDGFEAFQDDSDQPVDIRLDSGFSSSSTSPTFQEDSTPSADADTWDRAGLYQEEILHNYHEFADRRLFKDAGLVNSPVSDGERKVYESIFLEDSDEWSPVTDNTSMTVDTVMDED